MTRNKLEKTERLAAEVRRQIGAEAMKRFLRTLPAFRTETDIPDRFGQLLDHLDRVEDGDVGWRRAVRID
ncbi:hypothetical protein O7A70_02090 [Mesorhizobium sp. Cs1299R1N1]|uniref:Uncharacterized protein n=1 Tax=Mesorhizobium salmacidum TaxID=3015171 RepID=A0ABU8KS24_9HYPH|nr:MULTISPECIES: hypothetical protein [unclassified Mesorhizobium]TPM09934.1 hypothetical protein FJ960_04085 [Mesorhizobium sp. B2-3-11]